MAAEEPDRVRERARQRARLDAVFGSALPESARDERNEPVTERTAADYRRDRPPHHGG